MRLLAAVLALSLVGGGCATPRGAAWTTATTAYAGATYADIRTTELGLERGAHELNPFLPEHPTDTRLYGQGMLFGVLFHWWARELYDRGYRKTAYGMLWVATGIHAGAAWHNDGVQR